MTTPREFDPVRKYCIENWVRQIKQTVTLENLTWSDKLNEICDVFRFSASDLDPVIEAMREKFAEEERLLHFFETEKARLKRP